VLRSFGRPPGPVVFGEQTGGEPATVLALPGWMRTRADFATVLAGLDAIAVDLPGFGGATPEPATATGAAGYAEAVEPVLDACRPGVVVLGHSFGGRVAVHLAASHPDRVGALVLTGVPRLVKPATTSTPKATFRLLRWLHRKGLVSDARMEARRQRDGSADYRNARGVMRDVLVRVVNEDYESLLPRIACPVTLVWGDDDTAAPLSGAERAQPLFAGAAVLRVVAGAGHLTPLTAPAALRAAIDEHLATSEQQP
jgi:pimeloyl-ACP methyl ester carboxylesterase